MNSLMDDGACVCVRVCACVHACVCYCVHIYQCADFNMCCTGTETMKAINILYISNL